MENVGKMVEELEYTLKNEIEEIYIKKTQEIIDKERNNPNLEKQNNEQSNKIKEMFIDLKNQN